MASKRELSPEKFALLCFIQMMQHGAGLISKSPEYIFEDKYYMLSMGYMAIQRLDYLGKKSIFDYCDHWNIKIPKVLVDYFEAEKEQVLTLAGKGIFPDDIDL